MTEEGILEGEFETEEAEEIPPGGYGFFWFAFFAGLVAIAFATIRTHDGWIVWLMAPWGAAFFGVVAHWEYMAKVPLQICSYFDYPGQRIRHISTGSLKLLHDVSNPVGEYRLERGGHIPAAFRPEGKRLVRALLNLAGLV